MRMVMPNFDIQSGCEQRSNGSTTTGEAAVNMNYEMSPDHLEPYLGIQTGNEMSIDPPAPAMDTGTMVVAPSSQTTVTDGMDNVNYDADESEISDNTDEEYDPSDSEDSSDSSEHTPTSVISYSLINFYRTIDGVSSDSDASSNGDSVQLFVVAVCLICRRDYTVPSGTIVCTRCGYAGLVHYGDN
ncbi:hypothetical protein PR202_ga16928 [Eleusine coracana subsp. coracana]|uniref:Uncharacterized protein n=1 Tax=Eleusine coracana subsp. coracana TaxID=191504 RepID=A0AAV5CP02_ELECO|nr:hypothetical protein PR202_ga16928 [Eleusine coracana subsp. coracana]